MMSNESFKALQQHIPELKSIHADENDIGEVSLRMSFAGYKLDEYGAKAESWLKENGINVTHWVITGRTGHAFRRDDMMDIMFLIRVPLPEPQTIMPPRMKVPDKVSDKAMELLRLIRDGADVQVHWYQRSFTIYVNDDERHDLHNAYRTELTQVGEGKLFDGYGWMSITVGQCVLIDQEVVSSDYNDGIWERLVLSEEGKKFMDAHRTAHKDGE